MATVLVVVSGRLLLILTRKAAVLDTGVVGVCALPKMVVLPTNPNPAASTAP